ncbi:extended synaptotagmin-2-A-like, partial [Gastrophryne carolinensis]
MSGAELPVARGETEGPRGQVTRRAIEEPLRPVTRRAIEEPLRPVTRRAIEEPLRPVTRRAIEEPLRPVTRRAIEEPLRPVTRGTSEGPLCPVTRRAIEEPLRPVTRRAIEEPLRPVTRRAIEEPLRPVTRRAIEEPLRPVTRGTSEGPLCPVTRRAIEEPLRPVTRGTSEGPLCPVTRRAIEEPLRLVTRGTIQVTRRAIEGPLRPLLVAGLRPLFRVLLVLVPVYICGRLGLSLAWAALGLFLGIIWLRNKRGKLSRLRASWEMLEDEAEAVTRGMSGHQLPAWVHFPDVERVEWVNKVVGQMWPYFGTYMEKLFQEKIEPLVRASNGHLKAFTFTKVHFGEKSPRINGIKAYTKKVDKREVILDIQLCYNGDCEINVEVKKLCKAGVKGVQVHGTLRVILGPLLSDVPFIGAVTFFFIQKP